VWLVERVVFLNELMQSLYGIELYGKRKIIDFQSHAPVQVDIMSTLEEASQIVTSATTAPQAFMVTQGGRYFGVCTVLDLLHRITEQQICSARHANPLTLLPGIVPTNDAIERLLYSRTAFSLAYYDLDHFKPYNDHYGYDAGDAVIQKLADILRSVYRKEFSLIGHIGGDDFVVVDMSEAAVPHCEEVLRRVKDAVPAFYSKEHVLACGIDGIDRQGQNCRFPLIGVSCGLVPPECTASCKSHPEISDLAAQAKKMAKQTPASSLFVDRRASQRQTG
jgi:GGDEF domain-containing protein